MGIVMDGFIERFGALRCYIIVYIILAAIIIAMAVFGDVTQRRFDFNGTRLRLVSVNTRSDFGLWGTPREITDAVVMRDAQGNRLTKTVARTLLDGDNGGTRFQQIVRVHYLDKEISSYGILSGSSTIYFSDGSRVVFPPFGQEPPYRRMNELQRSEYLLLRYLASVRENPRTAGDTFGIALVGLVTVALGLFAVIFPDKAWRGRTRLYVHGGEPTDFALFSIRALGIFIIVVMLIMMAIYL